MTHILDNPIWNALNTGNRQFAYGTEQARYIQRELGIFAGLKNNSEEDLNDLHAQLPVQSLIVLFTPTELTIPSGWKTELQKDIYQMVYSGEEATISTDPDVTTLGEKDIAAMLELTELTKPGPFLSRTIDFGNYEGIYYERDLVAMAGQRLQPDPYTEISAVCTHPGHTGKGYAAKLIRNQISKIRSASRIPFLHVNTDNLTAIKLYEKLGFRTRKQMIVYVIEVEK